MRRRLALTLLACIPLLAACGEEQEPPPDVFAVKEPRGAKREVFRDAGITLERPVNWKLRRRDAPGVFEILSGEALVAGWAYTRSEPLPESAEQLESARKRLVEAIEQRDPAFELKASGTGEVADSPSIEILGTQVISKRRLRTRSVHVFEGDVEYVFEALAPPESFTRTNRVLDQALRSMELTGEVVESSE